MSDLPSIILPGGFEVLLGRTPPKPEHMLYRSGLTSFTAYLQSKGLSLIPQAQWKPIDNRSVFDNKFCNYQLKYGACVGASCAMAVEKERFTRGQPFVALSWQYIYDQLNGGRDRGACITSAMQVMLNSGAPPVPDYFPVPQFNTKKQPDSRSRFKLDMALTLTHWNELCTAIQMGFMVQYPVQVGQNYNNFDADGCCGVDRGQGNHSVHADGMIQLPSGVWVLTHMGSWDLTWGPFKNGRAFHRQAHIENCAMEDDAFTHISVNEDPADGEEPPTFRSAA